MLHSPIEFVREKQAMFAEIDAFELESEEEEPEETTGTQSFSHSHVQLHPRIRKCRNLGSQRKMPKTINHVSSPCFLPAFSFYIILVLSRIHLERLSGAESTPKAIYHGLETM